MATVDRRGVSVDATDTPIAGNPNPGLAIKAACLVATTGNITLAGLQTVDGVALAEANRVLVWQQADPTLNGLYNASSGDWTRTVDANGNDELAAGLRVGVSAGTTFAHIFFELTTADPITLGVSNLAFASNSVLPTRHINTTAPLTGGGDLTADRTLAIAANGITYSLFQQVAAASLVGNPTGLLANGQGITLGATLAFSGVSLQTVALTGDISTSANSFVTAIGANKVTSAMLRQGAALSVIGVTGNATANEADIAGTANQVLRVNAAGTSLTFGLVAYAGLQQVAASRLLGNPTGGAATVAEISLGATLAFSGTALQTTALSGDITSSANSFVTAIAAGAVTNTKMANMAAFTVKGNATSGSAAPTDISIPALTQKATPVSADMVLLVDSAASNALKFATLGSIASRPPVAFRATKNNVDQTGIASGTPTTVTFGTVDFDQGSHYASNAWTPPAGLVIVSAVVLNAGTNQIAGNASIVSILKNGTPLKNFIDCQSGANLQKSLSTELIDTANGSDVYTVQVTIVTNASTATISGATQYTKFSGVCFPS